MRKISLLFGLLFVLTFFQCKTDYEPITYKNYDSEWVFPLAKSKLTLKRIADNSKDTVGFSYYLEDDFYHLSYLQTRREYVRDFYVLPTVNKNFTKTVGDFTADDPDLAGLFGGSSTAVAPQGVEYESSFSEVVDFDMGAYQAQLEYIDFREGFLDLKIEKSLNQTLEIELTIPGLTKGGGSFKENITLSPSENSWLLPKLDLTGYRLTFATDAAPNQFKINGEVTVIGANNTISTSDKIDVNFDLTSLEYEVVKGIVGLFTIDKKIDTIHVNFFDNLDQVNMTIKDPKILLSNESTLGVPSTLVIDQLEMQRGTAPSDEVILKDKNFDLPVYNDISGGDAASTAEDEISNESVASGPSLSTILNQGKDKVIPSSYFEVGDLTDPSFFITHDSYVETALDLVIPLELNINNYVYSDTADNDLSSIEDVVGEDGVEYAEFYAYIYNTFPLDVDLQIMFAHDGLVIDTLISFDDPFIVTSLEDVDNTENVEAVEVLLGRYDKDRINGILDANQIILSGRVKTTESQTGVFVKLKEDAKLSIALDAKLGVNVNLEGDK